MANEPTSSESKLVVHFFRPGLHVQLPQNSRRIETRPMSRLSDLLQARLYNGEWVKEFSFAKLQFSPMEGS